MDSSCRPEIAASFEFPLALVLAARESYATDVVWRAPRRGVVWHGRDEVTAKLLLESAAMQALRVSQMRRAGTAAAGRVIHEFSARFIYSGAGIEHLDLPRGADVELERLRILTVVDGLIAEETCIETWTPLGG